MAEIAKEARRTPFFPSPEQRARQRQQEARRHTKGCPGHEDVSVKRATLEQANQGIPDQGKVAGGRGPYVECGGELVHVDIALVRPDLLEVVKTATD